MSKPLLTVLLVCAAIARGDDGEAAAILELGAAPSWGLAGESSLGPATAIEFTPIENCLELEAGVTPGFHRGAVEWSADVLFKKPWALSKKLEFMAGAGPEWIRAGGSNSAAIEFAVDFMYWPSRKRRLGWYIEPAYDYSFAPGHEKSIAVSFGLLIAIGRGR